MKGWRTLAWNALSGAVGLTAILVVVNYRELGFEPITAAWIALAMKLADNVANAVLRYHTTTPVGRKQ